MGFPVGELAGDLGLHLVFVLGARSGVVCV